MQFDLTSQKTQPSCAMRIKLRQQLWLGKQGRLPPAVMTLSVPRLALKACMTSLKVETDADRLFSRCHVWLSINQLYILTVRKKKLKIKIKMYMRGQQKKSTWPKVVVVKCRTHFCCHGSQCVQLFSSVLLEDLFFFFFLWIYFYILSPGTAASRVREIVELSGSVYC